MDKLRAIEYFNRAAETGSFAAAARTFNVSTSAVAQLVGALERSLGTDLFHRSPSGLALTAAGERYSVTARRVAEDLKGVEQQIGVRGAKPRGTLTVGMRHVVAQVAIMPRIGRFLARFPDVELVTKNMVTVHDIDALNLDLAVFAGWPSERDLVMRRLAQTRHVVCASPDYWMRAGKPREPEELLSHHCLVFRSTSGVMLDRWIFEKQGERRTVDVKTRLLSDDRSWLDAAALAGAGVIRLNDLTAGPYLSSGLLVPVLTDWEALEAPAIFAAYHPRQRRSRLVRVFVDFLVELFAELQAGQSAVRLPGATTPEWFGRVHGRQSSYTTRGKRRSASTG
jgi:DNA-binding transcriptional LysR family regulator